MTPAGLGARFSRLFAADASTAFGALSAAYAEPLRAYHTLAHVAACLRELDTVDLPASQSRSVEIALWWHDAVYDPRRADNEARSAELAAAHLAALGEPTPRIAEAARLIELTAGHVPERSDACGRVIVSVDLAVLGAEELEYDAYAAAIRREYAHLSDAEFNPGRAAVLAHFLDADVIYPEPAFERRLGDSARANLSREIARLERRA